MTLTELDDRTPDQIERDIAARRASLKGKLNALEHRLSPGERIHEMRQHLHPETVAPWAAVGAIATGAVLAMRGLRRHRTSSMDDDILIDDGVLDETVCVDVAVPPGTVP
jgi:hypothetical protein